MSASSTGKGMSASSTGKGMSASSTEIFQKAMDLSLEWGKEWLKPINDRIRATYPSLTEAEAEELNRKCKEIQKYCWDDLCWKEADGLITQPKIVAAMKARYPELSDANLNRLISQGYYYARK
jgi:hypothetical protein